MKAYACSKGEFQVVGAECVVVDCDVNDIVKELWFAEEVFCNPKPKAEKLQSPSFQHIAMFRFARVICLKNTRKGKGSLRV